jgi:DNA-binding XRE family transcriptional regulator
MIEPASNRLASLREAAELDRRDLAGALGVTEDTIRRLEVTTCLIPSKYIPTLVALLQTTTDYLMGWDRSESSKQEASAA